MGYGQRVGDKIGLNECNTFISASLICRHGHFVTGLYFAQSYSASPNLSVSGQRCELGYHALPSASQGAYMICVHQIANHALMVSVIRLNNSPELAAAKSGDKYSDSGKNTEQSSGMYSENECLAVLG